MQIIFNVPKMDGGCITDSINKRISHIHPQRERQACDYRVQFTEAKQTSTSFKPGFSPCPCKFAVQGGN